MRAWPVIGLVILCLCGMTATGCSDSSDPATTSLNPAASTATAPTTTEPVITTTSTTVPTTTTAPLSPAEELLASMTLRQKAAQVLLLTIDGTTVSASTQELLAEGPPGGVLLLGHNVKGELQTQALTQGLQTAAASSGSKVGLFIAVDQEGGLVQRIHEGVPEVPQARELGETASPEDASLLAAETADGLVALGVNMNLAPVADVVNDPQSFLYSRTYGGDPEVVSAFVSAVTEAYVRGGLISVVKHFPGHGSASGNTHGEEVVSEATEAEFDAIYLPPFQAAFAAGAQGAMMAHIIAKEFDNERPASQSRAVIDDLLRRDLGFAGLVVSDDLEMAAATGSAATSPGEDSETARADALAEASVTSLAAGCDLLICTGTLARNLQLLEAIVAAVTNGDLSPARLDEAVMAVLELKLRQGIVAPSVPPPS